MKKIEADIEKKGNYSYMTMAKYLPSINAYYNYSKYHDNDGNEKFSKENTQTFGLTLNIPFDSRTLNDVQSKKIDYLKSKINLENNNLKQNSMKKLVLLFLEHACVVHHFSLPLNKSLIAIFYLTHSC